MRIVDVHSHWGTKRGYVLRTDAALAQQSKTWRSEPKYDTEDEMAQYLRANGVRAILDFGFTKNLPLDELVPLHDYALEVQAKHPDAILGHWLQIDPKLGEAGAAELEHCIRASKGFIGYCVSASGMGYTADHAIYGPFYEVLKHYRRPGARAGRTHGLGRRAAGRRRAEARPVPSALRRLPRGRPPGPHHHRGPARVAVAGRDDLDPAAQAQRVERTARLVAEVPDRRAEARDPRRLKDRVMFGADYPLFRYERLVDDWTSLGYDDDVLARVFHRNAERLFGLASSEGAG